MWSWGFDRLPALAAPRRSLASPPYGCKTVGHCPAFAPPGGKVSIRHRPRTALPEHPLDWRLPLPDPPRAR
jgi:hypothetical protein